MSAIEVVFVDNAVIGFRWTDRTPDGDLVYKTFAEAKRAALATARANRDEWRRCIESINQATVADVVESRPRPTVAGSWAHTLDEDSCGR